MTNWVYDTEGDDLYPAISKFHCLVFKQVGRDRWKAFCNISEVNPTFLEGITKEIDIEFHEIEEFKGWVESGEVRAIICHNQLGFDLWAMEKLLGVQFDVNPDTLSGKEVKFVDTLTMSRCLHPDRLLPKNCPDSVYNPVTKKMDKVGPHGLMAWGYRVANMKPEVHDWRDQPLSVYLHRCIEDVKINELVFYALKKEMGDKAVGSDGWADSIRASHIRDFLMIKQGYDGVQFDREKAIELLAWIDGELSRLANEVEPTLPLKKIGKTTAKEFIPPKNQFVASGELSSHMEKFLEKHEGKVIRSYEEEVGVRVKKTLTIPTHVEIYGKQWELPLPAGEPIVTEEPMKLGNQDDIKAYLIESGWEPTLWRFRDVTRDAKKRNYTEEKIGEKVREYIQEMRESPYRRFIESEMEVDFSCPTEAVYKKLSKKVRFLASTPQLKDQKGDLCPNLELMKDERSQKIVRWLSLRNRRAVLKGFDDSKGTGWLNNPRLDIDGRLPASSSGPANTHRQKHRVVVNVPKAEESVLLGKEFRSLFIAKPGFKIVGGDAQALENRVGGWYAYRFDKGAYAKKMLEEDSHTINAQVYSEAAGFEVTRGQGKNITYAIMYGAQAPKIAKMLGVSGATAKMIIDAFWQSNPGLAAVKGEVEKYWEGTGKKYIRGIDGRKVYTRSKHSLLNALFQSCGAIVMDYAGIFVDKWLKQEGLYKEGVKRILYVHDELQFEVPEHLVKEDKSIVGEYIVKGIRAAGKHLGSPILIDAEYMIGNNWAETH